ncbi:response regulator [Paratractidigestivibacter sp.]|uniref:response regulator n=2 Tax=Paratractidigestivibacter sp. TaxID=2847316 RepID=UPI002ACB0CCE|nr:response regulator [Paratractidigestivibacter sp.]
MNAAPNAQQGGTIVDLLSSSDSYSTDDIIADLGSFHKADRAYIFRIDPEKGIAYNTHEWCAPGVVPQIEYLQALPLTEIQGVEDAVKKGDLVIEDIDEELDHEDPLYKILAPQDIHSIILAPLNINGEFAGYIGVDNPRANCTMSFLQTVSSVVLSAKLNSETDGQALEESQVLLKKLCEQYTTLFYVDLSADYIHVYEANDSTGSKYADYRSYARAMGKYIQSDVVEGDRERMRELTAAAHVMEQFKAHDAFEVAFDENYLGRVRNRTFRFIRANEAGTCAVVCGADVTARVEAEKRRRAELEEQLSVINALARSFKNAYLLNLKTTTAKILKLEDDFVDERLDDVVNQEFPFEAFLSAWIADAVHPDDQERLANALSVEHLHKVFAQQDEYTGNYRMLVDGQVYNYQFSLNTTGDHVHVVAGFQNIDGIVAEHAEHQRQLEEQFDIINTLSTSFFNAYVVNMDSNEARIIKLGKDYNSKYIRDVKGTTFPYDVVVGNWIREIVHPEDRQRISEAFNMDNLRDVFSRQTELIGTYRSIIDGVTHHYQYEFRKIGDTHSVVCGFMQIDDIIEERKAIKREQREHTEVMQSLSNIYTTIIKVDIDTHQFEVFNSVPLMEAVTGKGGDFDEKKQAILDAFMAPDMQPHMADFLDFSTLAERLKDTNTIATEYKGLNGKWVQTSFVVKRRDEKGAAKEALYVVREITDEKLRDLEQQEALTQALAAAQQANRAKSTFLNSMSHDIRTPMNAIIGFTALAQTHLDDTALVQDYLGKIGTSGTHLLSLINDILDMSRIESGTVKLDEKPLHLPDLMRDLRTMVQGLVNAKNQHLFIDTQDVVHEDVICDELRLNQILINIVGNANKFTPVGGDIIIRLAEKPCSTPHYTTLEFSVKDNGIGMSEEFLGHIFDTFSREYSSTVSGEQGTGLGMAITKNIVDMMGGQISVESEEGKGSCFTVTLDLRLAGEAADREPIPELLGARALVVDDDLDTCRSVSKMLHDIQMRPDWTASGHEAVIRAQDAQEMGDEYKVYIIDYLMPDMNGIETVRRIRRVISDDVPIIVLTAYDWGGFEAEAREAGVTAFVSKPIFMSELRQVLTRPAGAVDAGGGAATAGAGGGRRYDYSGRHVLLVEDNELNREIACAILGETGMVLDTVNDGDEAVAAVADAPAGTYDLVLMDIQMPRMDGYTATREIRTLPDNEKANVPIVAMTANAFDEDRDKAFRAGMNGHIIKPISIDAIAAVLDHVFS